MQEQIRLHGDDAYPLNGELEYEIGDHVELLVRKMPEDQHGLDWSKLLNVVDGLWWYIVEGMRYRTVTFDVLDIDNDTQIGWGHIVTWYSKRDSSSNRNARRGLEISSLALLSTANSNSGKRNSSISNLVGKPYDWPIEDTDMTLRLTMRATPLNPEAVRMLFIPLIEIVQKTIADRGADAILGGQNFRYGDLVVLEVINSPHMLSWGQFATVIFGLVDFIVNHGHYQACYFTIYLGDPKVEIAIGKVARGTPHNNITVARRNAVEAGEVDPDCERG